MPGDIADADITVAAEATGVTLMDVEKGTFLRSHPLGNGIDFGAIGKNMIEYFQRSAQNSADGFGGLDMPDLWDVVSDIPTDPDPTLR